MPSASRLPLRGDANAMWGGKRSRLKKKGCEINTRQQGNNREVEPHLSWRPTLRNRKLMDNKLRMGGVLRTHAL